MGYIEQLCKWVKCEKPDVKDICLTIDTETSAYPLSFIEFETRDFLGINYTDSEFKERFVVLNKKYIVSVAMVYQDDIEIDDDTHHTDVQYN